MRRLLKVVLLVSAVLAAGSASGVPLVSEFPEFAGELQARLDLLPATGLTRPEKKQKAALKKALAALAVDPADMSKSIRSVRKAIAATDGAFAGDVTFGPLETDVIGRVANDVLVRNGQLVRSIDRLAEGTLPRTRAQAKIDDAGASLAASQTATTHSLQLTLIAKALTAIVAGEKIVKKTTAIAGGGAGVTFSAFDVDVNTTATHLHMPQTEAPLGMYVVGYEVPNDVLKIAVTTHVGPTAYNMIINILGHGTGTRNAQVLGFTRFSTAGVDPPAQIVSGTATLTTWDLDAKKVAGTFDVTFSNGPVTIHLINGAFSTVEATIQE